MARVSYVEMDQASPEVREIYENTFKGKPGSVQKLLAHRPEMLKAFLAFYGSVGRSLDQRLYELIYIRVSMINGCRYCVQHHMSASKQVGLTAQERAALKNGDYAGFPAKEKAALLFAEKLTSNLHAVNDADVADLKKHFSDEEIVDLDTLVSMVNMTNRFTDPLGADLEFAEEPV